MPMTHINNNIIVKRNNRQEKKGEFNYGDRAVDASHWYLAFIFLKQHAILHESSLYFSLCYIL